MKTLDLQFLHRLDDHWQSLAQRKYANRTANGTLIDETYADEMLRAKNFIPAISVEGLRKPLIFAGVRVLEWGARFCWLFTYMPVSKCLTYIEAAVPEKINLPSLAVGRMQNVDGELTKKDLRKINNDV